MLQHKTKARQFFFQTQGANGRKRRQAAENRAARARAEAQRASRQQQARQQEEQASQQRRRAHTNSRTRSARHGGVFDEFQDANAVQVETVLESLGPEGVRSML